MTLAAAKHDTWNSQVNMHVANCQFSADIDFMTGEYRAEFGAPPAPSATGIVNAATIPAGAWNTFAANYKAALGPWGRQLVFVAGAATTTGFVVRGRDYLGQPIREDLALLNATPVPTVKIYKSLDNVFFNGAPGTAVSIGWTDVFGVPYRTMAVQNWFEGGVSATAGTLVAGSAANPQLINSPDPRGSVDFNSATNGTLTFSIIGIADTANIYGNKHFGG